MVNAEINADLKNLVASFKENYDIAVRKSEERYKTTLQPGQVFQRRDGFYSDADRTAFEKVCTSCREKAQGIIDAVKTDLVMKNTAAPSNDAVNMLAVVNSRQDLSENELDQLMTRYGSECPMVYKALHEKARSLGYHDFKQHPITDAAEKIEQLGAIIDRTMTTNYSGSTVAAVTGLNDTIDAAFPTDD